jgi:hypothetical protein
MTHDGTDMKARTCSPIRPQYTEHVPSFKPANGYPKAASISSGARTAKLSSLLSARRLRQPRNLSRHHAARGVCITSMSLQTSREDPAERHPASQALSSHFTIFNIIKQNMEQHMMGRETKINMTTTRKSILSPAQPRAVLLWWIFEYPRRD